MSYNTLVRKSEDNYMSNGKIEKIDIFNEGDLSTDDRKKFIESRILEYSEKIKLTESRYKSKWALNLLDYIKAFHSSEHSKIIYKLDQNWMYQFLQFMTTTKHKRKVTNVSILKHLNTLHLVLNFWNIQYNWKVPNYLNVIERKKQLKDEIFTDEEIEMFWKAEKELGKLPASAKVNKSAEERVHVLNLTLDGLLISLYTGCRMSEIQTIFRSFDTESQTELLGWYASKNKRAKFIPMHPRIKPIIERGWYKQLRRSVAWPALMKLVNITGQGQIIERTGQTLERKIVPRSKIVHFHSARQTFVVRMIECGMDLYELSKLMGHSSVQITERYYAVARERHMIAKTKEVFSRMK